MASLKKQRPSKNKNSRDDLLSQHVSSFLSEVFPTSFPAHLVDLSSQQDDDKHPILTVALSGGLDSCVLLHILANLRKKSAFQLSAHHVHHGLSQHADDWAAFCQETCRQLSIPLNITKVLVDANSGLGIESAARQVRYQALFNENPGFICTAHHQDDQTETLLLQLARGAGVKGLAAMAPVDTKKKLLRPLLGISRAELEQYAKQHQLAWVEDESNLNQQFDRNFIRHTILPAWQLQYPAIKQSLARSATHLAEANALLDILAAQDAEACIKQQQAITQLFLPPLQILTQSRIHNVLRWWLAQNHIRMPSTSQLEQIGLQLFEAKSDAAIKIKVVADHENSSKELTLRRYQDSAYLVTNAVANVQFDMIWNGEPLIHLSHRADLSFKQKLGEGFALKYLKDKQLVIKNRTGGERFKPDLNRPGRSLKFVLQTAQLPPWQRERIPLIYLDDTLVIIPNIGVEAHFKAQPDEMGLLVTWVE